GTLCENSALQARPVTRVSPIVYACVTVLPVVLAPCVAGEGWSRDPGVRAVLVASLVLAAGSAVQLAGTPAVAGLIAADSSSEVSETARRPRERRSATTRSTETSDDVGTAPSCTTTIAPARSSSSGASR